MFPGVIEDHEDVLEIGWAGRRCHERRRRGRRVRHRVRVDRPPDDELIRARLGLDGQQVLRRLQACVQSSRRVPGVHSAAEHARQPDRDRDARGIVELHDDLPHADRRVGEAGRTRSLRVTGRDRPRRQRDRAADADVDGQLRGELRRRRERHRITRRAPVRRLRGGQAVAAHRQGQHDHAEPEASGPPAPTPRHFNHRKPLSRHRARSRTLRPTKDARRGLKGCTSGRSAPDPEGELPRHQVAGACEDVEICRLVPGPSSASFAGSRAERPGFGLTTRFAPSSAQVWRSPVRFFTMTSVRPGTTVVHGTFELPDLARAKSCQRGLGLDVQVRADDGVGLKVLGLHQVRARGQINRPVGLFVSQHSLVETEPR